MFYNNCYKDYFVKFNEQLVLINGDGMGYLCLYYGIGNIEVVEFWMVLYLIFILCFVCMLY